MACEPLPSCATNEMTNEGPGIRMCCSIEPTGGLDHAAIWVEICANETGLFCPLTITMNRDVVGDCCPGPHVGELDNNGDPINAATGTELARLTISNIPRGGCFRIDSAKRERTMTIGNQVESGLPYVSLGDGQATTPWLIYDGCFPVCVCAQTENHNQLCSPNGLTFSAGWTPLQV